MVGNVRRKCGEDERAGNEGGNERGKGRGEEKEEEFNFLSLSAGLYATATVYVCLSLPLSLPPFPSLRLALPLFACLYAIFSHEPKQNVVKESTVYCSFLSQPPSFELGHRGCGRREDEWRTVTGAAVAGCGSHQSYSFKMTDTDRHMHVRTRLRMFTCTCTHRHRDTETDTHIQIRKRAHTHRHISKEPTRFSN